ncbi:PIN2/TERF1-interacting telomerase inhibitor 1 [Clinocottus analis]|uniref:PIN2/TERF1-interacting telomerase inhibitor 1 n=1 Tax=Clinocottus analis TaxID=304258 RepID=UPI0035BFB3E2
MSMLAQPRKKQKWSIDPRNSNWSKDDSKFGQKLMERMGWSKGKGLGVSEQGMVDHVKVKVKNDQLGIGHSVSYEDNWIAHQDDFNELLAQLNNCHGQNSSAEAPPPEEAKAFSLEEKSKSSKKRVHYMKFAKGKDLSSRSETDLNCIFGKRGKPAKPEQESNSSDSPGETKETFTPAAFELDTESITNTVTSTLSMQEYFAQRMAQLKNGRGEAQAAAPSMETDETSGPSDEPSPVLSDDDDDSEEPKRPTFKLASESIADTVKPPLNVEEYFAQRVAQLKKRREQAQSTDPSTETDETSDKPSPTLIIDDNSEEPKRKKKKKKKKSKMSADDLEAVDENSSAVPIIVIEDNEETPQEFSSQKKKKRNVVESEGAAKENCASTAGVEQDCEELPPSKKRKKLKKRHEEPELLNGHGPPEDQTVEPEVALKKKKKHRVELDDGAKDEEEELVEKKSKKDKKKKRRI